MHTESVRAATKQPQAARLARYLTLSNPPIGSKSLCRSPATPMEGDGVRGLYKYLQVWSAPLIRLRMDYGISRDQPGDSCSVPALDFPPLLCQRVMRHHNRSAAMFYCYGIKEMHGSECVNLQMLCTEVKEGSCTSGAH